MTTLVCLLAVVLAQQPGHDRLTVKVELASWKVHILDPLFAKVSLVNTTDETVRISPDLFHTAGYHLSFGRYPYAYRFDSEYVTGGIAPDVPIAPEKKCILDYEILEFPPIHQLKHDFWRDVVGKTGDINISVGIDSRHSTAQVHILRRPPKEMEFLTQLYAESVRRNEANQAVEDWDSRQPLPGHFGLRSFRPDNDLVEKLLDYEEHLSPGSLRDVVHLTGLMRTIYASEDEAEQKKLVQEVLAWLDTLPEIERQCLADRIRLWAASNFMDGPAYYILVYGAIQRLPKQAFQHKDYRAYRLKNYSSVGFQAYLKQMRAKRGGAKGDIQH